MANNKKLKEYFNLGMRKIKHRKGFGVHSPFAFSIITEVIEEKLPYYAYQQMQRLYSKQTPIAFKTACLLFRLANRFRCHTFAEIASDGGFSILPLLLLDKRNQVKTVAEKNSWDDISNRLGLFHIPNAQYSFAADIEDIEETQTFDMLIINGNPFSQNDPRAAAVQLAEWVMKHTNPESLIFVKGIQPRQQLELFWDQLCDNDEVSITMDLYNNGLAILKPHFFKQHYIVSF